MSYTPCSAMPGSMAPTYWWGTPSVACMCGCMLNCTRTKWRAWSWSTPRTGAVRALGRSADDPRNQCQVLLSTQSLGDKPLAVITAGEQQEPIWLELQEELAALSSDSVHRVVEGRRTDRCWTISVMRR